MTKTAAIVAATLAAGTPQVAASDTYGKYETPPYRVEQQLGPVEIRAYAPHILAEVTLDGAQNATLSQGFRILAGYIFGGNSDNRSIDMTTPVGQSQQIGAQQIGAQQIEMTAPVGQSAQDGRSVVTFMMPSNWTLDTLPTPENPAIRFQQVETHRQVVHQFSGRATPSAIQKASDVLQAGIEEHGITVTGPMLTYRYDDPMTLPWRRRNEVAFRVSN